MPCADSYLTLTRRGQARQSARNKLPPVRYSVARCAPYASAHQLHKPTQLEWVFSMPCADSYLTLTRRGQARQSARNKLPPVRYSVARCAPYASAHQLHKPTQLEWVFSMPCADSYLTLTRRGQARQSARNRLPPVRYSVARCAPYESAHQLHKPTQ